MNKAVLGLFFSKVTGALLNLILLFVTVHYMGAEQRGLISMFILQLSFVMLAAEWMTGPVLVYYVSRRSLKSLFKNAWLWTVPIVFVSCLVLFFLDLQINLIQYFFIFLFQSVISFHNQLFLGNQKYFQLNISQILQSFSLLALLVLHIYLGKLKIGAYLDSMLVSSILIILLQLFFLKKIDRKEDEPSLQFSEVFKSGSYTSFTNLFHLITNRNSFLLVSSLGGAVTLGVYSTSVSMSEAMLLAASSMGMFLYSKTAAVNATQNRREIIRYVIMSALLTSCFIAMMIAIPQRYFESILGRDFTGVKSLILQLSPSVLLMAMIQVLSHYFSGKGMFRANFIAGLCSSLLIICVGNFAMQTRGLTGIITATNLAVFIQFAVLLAYFIYEGKRSGSGD